MNINFFSGWCLFCKQSDRNYAAGSQAGGVRVLPCSYTHVRTSCTVPLFLPLQHRSQQAKGGHFVFVINPQLVNIIVVNPGSVFVSPWVEDCLINIGHEKAIILSWDACSFANNRRKALHRNANRLIGFAKSYLALSINYAAKACYGLSLMYEYVICMSWTL